MSSKIIVAALAVVALQALWVQTSSVGVAAEDSNGGLNLGDADPTPITPSFDFGVGNAIVQALQNIVNGIVDTIRASQKTVAAVTARIGDINDQIQVSFGMFLKQLADHAAELDPAKFTACEAQQPSTSNLASVSTAFAADLDGCTRTSTSDAEASIRTLESVRSGALALVGDIRQAFLDCQRPVSLAIPCFAAKSPKFFAAASSLASNATRLASDVNRELSVDIPQKHATCAAAASAKRTAEANAIFDAILKCMGA